ncbi:MAG: hypothetical protein JSV16_08800 [Candidatus Hydrogenedentota bacterium]|nr:MAG: hypothetical protein JSV16_08800 [Candidatus Hydrogenedentota bacterium]
MKSMKILVVVVLALSFLATATQARAVTQTLHIDSTQGADTWLWGSLVYGTWELNYGGDWYLQAQDKLARRVILRFDNPGTIGSPILSATLKLYVTDAPNPGIGVSVYMINWPNHGWNEGSSTGQFEWFTATWGHYESYYPPNLGTPWWGRFGLTIANKDYIVPKVASRWVGENHIGQWVDFDFTPDGLEILDIRLQHSWNMDVELLLIASTNDFRPPAVFASGEYDECSLLVPPLPSCPGTLGADLIITW